MTILRALCSAGVLMMSIVTASAEPLSAGSVLEEVAQRKSDRERGSYLKANANAIVEGLGSLESIAPRKFFDTSVPDSNAVVAMIRLDETRKVVCGLPKEVFDSLGWLQPGSPVSFRGKLSDAQGWEQILTLYLSDCVLARRK